ncbi:hypothetical protein B0H17DRAFT_1154970 [Mycena rosella]|uniref:Uncharacterized protein n=1 Tax=Mycena rosella TaxID=1033263 RepID=A0AAD7F5J3_MYCRO|nr:hypothetical protein B0H17DRAFT_1154970 [Mycena rosella]
MFWGRQQLDLGIMLLSVKISTSKVADAFRFYQSKRNGTWCKAHRRIYAASTSAMTPTLTDLTRLPAAHIFTQPVRAPEGELFASIATVSEYAHWSHDELRMYGFPGISESVRVESV